MNYFFRYFYTFSIISILFSLISGCGFLGMELIKDHPGEANEVHYCDTEDGWRLALSRYVSPSAAKDTTRAPIILCHGLGYNHHFWDLDSKIDFARTLAKEGFDVWLLSLRGSGMSTKPGISILKNLIDVRKGEINNVSFEPSKLDWNVDDYIRYDIPAALKFVTSYTKKPKVLWVGHSLGGMIMYGYLGLNNPAPEIQGVVTVGSPLIVPQPPNKILKAFEANKLLFKTFLIINTRTGATGIAPFHRFLITPDEVLMYNKENVDPITIGMVLEFVVEDLPVGVVDQVMDMVKTGKFRSADRSIDYTKRAKRITVPVLFCCGKADNLAYPESVRFAYQTITSEDKSFAMFGTANGQAHDYGHNDLILGKHAKKEVYPEIIKWIKAHSTLEP